ncbi:MAG: hypothetical protein A3G34_07030 [Candidatus Lindowbacteria bacterium RIFCSPLOWO2_12_FULL_62_27]|nr:MAG: hypothetical protein A3G34_07030 [Candidatus Lindowbacteria bacterium RIFCSPLOWO2_12_FULL_62_27]
MQDLPYVELNLGYLRKSKTQEDRQVSSIPAQEKELCDLSERHSKKIDKFFRDEKRAKEPYERDEFNAMVEEIKLSKSPVGLWTWKPNRLARNGLEGETIVYLLKKEKIAFIATPRKIFLNTIDDRKLLKEKFSEAEIENDERGEDIQRGKRSERDMGKWTNGAAPYGFNKSKETKHLEPNPVTAPIKAEFYYRYAHSELISSIAGNFHDRGIHIKQHRMKDWTTETALATSCGHIATGYRKKEIMIICRNAHTALIDEETAEACRVRRQRGADRSGARQPRTRPPSPLRGIKVRCGECGNALQLHRNKSKHGTFRHRDPDRRRECNNTLPARPILELLLGFLRVFSVPERFLSLLAEVRRNLAASINAERLEGAKAERDGVKKLLKAAHDELVPVTTDKLPLTPLSDLSREEIRQRIKNIEERLKGIERDIKLLENHQQNEIDASVVAARLAELVQNADPSDAKALSELFQRLIDFLVIGAKDAPPNEGGTQPVIVNSKYQSLMDLSTWITRDDVGKRKVCLNGGRHSPPSPAPDHLGARVRERLVVRRHPIPPHPPGDFEFLSL